MTDNITLKLDKVELIGKDGKPIKNDKGQIEYLRDDAVTLTMLLNLYNTNKRGSFFKQGKIWLSVKEKVRTALRSDSEEVILTQDEARFIKNYLKDFDDNEGKDRPHGIQEFEARTIFGTVEQLEQLEK